MGEILGETHSVVGKSFEGRKSESLTAISRVDKAILGVLENSADELDPSEIKRIKQEACCGISGEAKVKAFDAADQYFRGEYL